MGQPKTVNRVLVASSERIVVRTSKLICTGGSQHATLAVAGYHDPASRENLSEVGQTMLAELIGSGCVAIGFLLNTRSGQSTRIELRLKTPFGTREQPAPDPVEVVSDILETHLGIRPATVKRRLPSAS